MNYITDLNDRKRRRQARRVTFIVTTTLLVGGLYSMGAADQLVALVQQLFGTAAPAAPVA